ncbi:T9SS type A sorting domain-containing protein [candidate division KSB1 bacterium]|nr:T9SS type A sorting domain-containing protein [candidate division KSB1 bacterium]
MVNLKIYSLHGREVASPVDGQLSAGAHAVEWQAQNLASGVYFYRLQTGTMAETTRMILLKQHSAEIVPRFEKMMEKL